MKNTDRFHGLPLNELAQILDITPAELRELLAERGRGNRFALRARLGSPVVRDLLSALGHTFEPQVIAVMNLKGGVGKTTTAITVASRAARLGYRTCVLDLDAQASASFALDVLPGDDDLVFNDLWDDPKLAVDAVREIEPGFTILPSALENSLLDVSLANPRAQKSAVAGVCKALQRAGTELIFIDCPPSLGAAVISATCAADRVLLPCACDAYSLRGLELMVGEVGAIRETFGLDEVAIDILPTLVDRRQRHTVKSLAALQRTYGDRLLPAIIRVSTEIVRALEDRRTIYSWARRSGAKEDFDQLARHLLSLEELPKLARGVTDTLAAGETHPRFSTAQLETATG